MSYLYLLCLLLLATVTAGASPTPYDDSADAKKDIQAALARAARTNQPVIIVFGANWCPDCRVLDTAMKSGASAKLLAEHFQIVKVSIGRHDKNLDVAKTYGVPLEKGIPTVVIVSPKNEIIYATHAGELADARHLGDQGIYDFFKRVTDPATLKQ